MESQKELKKILSECLTKIVGSKRKYLIRVLSVENLKVQKMLPCPQKQEISTIKLNTSKIKN